MTENERIKPCPWCGFRPALEDPEAWRGKAVFCIECERCNVSMWSWAGEKSNDLIKRWNTR